MERITFWLSSTEREQEIVNAKKEQEGAALHQAIRAIVRKQRGAVAKRNEKLLSSFTALRFFFTQADVSALRTRLGTMGKTGIHKVFKSNLLY